MDNIWIVTWQNGKKQKYVPYDSYGMTSFIKRGLEFGKVFVNDREVVLRSDGIWIYKDEQDDTL